MKRTIDIVTAARAKGAELPAEWFRKTCKGRLLSEVPTPWVPMPTLLDYIGPDLELPENICHAFTVADALCAPGFRTEVWWVEERKLFSGTLDDGFNEILAPERHLALVAACEAALGIQHEKENT